MGRTRKATTPKAPDRIATQEVGVLRGEVLRSLFANNIDGIKALAKDQIRYQIRYRMMVQSISQVSDEVTGEIKEIIKERKMRQIKCQIID